MRHLFSKLYLRRNLRTGSNCCRFYSQHEPAPSSTTGQSLRVQELRGPNVENHSLSRGLALNKFQKDFIIFPEYGDSDEVKNIEGYSTALRNSLQTVKLDRMDDGISDEIKAILQNNGVSATFVPKEFDGGLGMCNKDLMKVFEELSVDFAISSHVTVIQSMSNLLVLFGSDAQKNKFLPLLANGKCRPAIAFLERQSQSSEDGSHSEVNGATGLGQMLSMKNARVFGDRNANLIAVFAKSTDVMTKKESLSCYLIDRTQMSEMDLWKYTPENTMGLKGFGIGTVNAQVSISPEHVIGEVGQGEEISTELSSTSHLSHAAAVVGFAKRLLSELSSYCTRAPSSSIGGLATVAQENSAQRVVTSLALLTYSLESSAYYVGGILDEAGAVTVDIENALLHKLTRDVLRECIVATLEILGVGAVDKELPFEKSIRDCASLLSLSNERHVNERLALTTIACAAANGYSRASSTLSRLFRAQDSNMSMQSPKLKHYIAEHAHPSLKNACQELEFSMSRLNTVLTNMIAEQGKTLEQDHASLDSLSIVLQNHMIMFATISRASRSYSIGLRNADLELGWTTMLATRLARQNWFELQSLADYFGIIRLNPSMLNVGRAVFEEGGYAVESPIARNW